VLDERGQPVAHAAVTVQRLNDFRRIALKAVHADD
jgi:hypothetical protein